MVKVLLRKMNKRLLILFCEIVMDTKNIYKSDLIFNDTETILNIEGIKYRFIVNGPCDNDCSFKKECLRFECTHFNADDLKCVSLKRKDNTSGHWKRIEAPVDTMTEEEKELVGFIL